MENYIINNKTIALFKSNKKTIIFDVDKIRVINKSIFNVINQNCMLNGSTLNGRIEYAKKYLNKKYKIPIIIDDYIILLPLKSIRNRKSIYVILNKINDYKIFNNHLKIYCHGDFIFFINISKYSFENMILNSFKLLNKNNEKNVNIV